MTKRDPSEESTGSPAAAAAAAAAAATGAGDHDTPAPASFLQTVLHILTYAPGTFYANPLKPLLNAVFGASYGLSYAHFRRDHSFDANVVAHLGCLLMQLWGNFALLYCADKSLGLSGESSGATDQLRAAFGWGLASVTALLWAASLAATPSPPSVTPPLSPRALAVFICWGCYETTHRRHPLSLRTGAIHTHSTQSPR